MGPGAGAGAGSGCLLLAPLRAASIVIGDEAITANTSRIAVILKRGIVRRCRSKSGTEESVELMTSCNLAGLGTQHRLQRPAEGTGEAGNALNGYP